MNSDFELQQEPLPGYKLIEKIGAGGYGEVWRVEAPGGLDKAMKFVFGTEHEKRATHELKALKRIKELRHPFLLSLERIEVVHGRLVVVTELADGSLKDCFERYRDQGQQGVPRDELIGYLRDAADALDYMFTTHALQHLDIKPENLLLVGGHVKVADFGLVKDIQQSQASIVGGMTPLYSAPEVFRGQPSNRSDQYSLAILYQEMLTGMLPFSGVTAAELTLQHLNDEPGLTPLDGADRYVVARALSKDPGHRYPSCREFVEALIRSESGADSTPSVGQAASGARCSVAVSTDQRPGRATEVFDDDDALQQPAESMLIDLPLDETEPHDLGPPEFTPGEFQPLPTLFLGIGGAGGRVLGHLRRQLNQRFGSPDRLPTAQLLLLDTDPKAVMDTTHDSQHPLSAEETLALPLRRPQHYRDNSARLLKWLSRRWLYNIPKSMRTEGLRPLGRLALVDHARQACQRIRHAIVQATDDVSVAQSRDALGLPLAEGVCRVYLVASIAGGTGSGMVLDLGYAVRAALANLGIEKSEVVAILMHSTSRDPRHGDLARVNTFSWLNEYQHFLFPGAAYPGDESCGLPAHPAGTRPFDHAYLLHLGEGLGDDDFDHAAESVADYLHLDALTPAGTFFAACRKAREESSPRSAGAGQLRTFGLHRLAATPSGLSESFVDEVTHRVLANWLDGDSQAETGVVELAERAKLTAPALAAGSRELLDGLLDGADVQSFLDRWLTQQQQGGAAPQGPAALAAVDRLFRKSDDGGGNAALIVVRQPLAEVVQPLVDNLRQQLGDWVRHRIDDPQLRLAGARRAADGLVSQLQTIQTQSQSLAKQVAGRLVEIRSAESDAAPAQAPPAADGANAVLSYLRLRFDHCAMLATEHVATVLIAEVKSCLDELNQFGRDLKQMVGRSEGDSSAPPRHADQQQAHLASQVESQLDELAERVDRRLQTQYLDEPGGLLAAITSGGRTRAQLFATLKEYADQAIGQALGEVNVLEYALGGQHGKSLQERVDQAAPELLKFGGAQRVLAVLPRSAAETGNIQSIQEALGDTVSLVPGPDNSFTLCVEGEGVPLPQVAVHLVQRRRDYIQFAERVHSRSDIRWTKLTDQLKPQASKNPQPVAVTQALDNATQLTGPVSQLFS